MGACASCECGCGKGDGEDVHGTDRVSAIARDHFHESLNVPNGKLTEALVPLPNVAEEISDLAPVLPAEVQPLVEHEASAPQQTVPLANLLQEKRQALQASASPVSVENRYMPGARLPEFSKGHHVPVLGLINPKSGAGAGADILELSRHDPYFCHRFFNIFDVLRGRERGGTMDLFRAELLAAVNEAQTLGPGVRPRLVSGGGDGTASFALFVVFSTLRADALREADGLKDSGNGFIWSDVEMENYFPALAQMPLGSANDFGHILGWGQKYPGDPAGRSCSSTSSAVCVCQGQEAGMTAAMQELYTWLEATMNPTSLIVGFDVWGIMPEPGTSSCNFKLAELDAPRGWNPAQYVNGRSQLQMKPAGLPVPFIVFLYFSAGFSAYMVARFQLNRRSTPLRNRLEYCRQGLGIFRERIPPQLPRRIDGVTVDCVGEPYFPPRRIQGNRGHHYRDVGFLNINMQANLFHGADRAGVLGRLCQPRQRKPVSFNDGLLDMYRFRLPSLIKNPGLLHQTDKRRDMTLSFDGKPGQGIFFQYDGEARFAFSPAGEKFTLHVRQILRLPVVLGPWHKSHLSGFNPTDSKAAASSDIKFQIVGDTEKDREQVRSRIFSQLSGDLNHELNATEEELMASGLRARS